MFVKAVSSEEVTDNSLRMKMSLNSADDKLIEDCLYHNLYHFSQGKMSNENLSALSFQEMFILISAPHPQPPESIPAMNMQFSFCALLLSPAAFGRSGPEGVTAAQSSVTILERKNICQTFLCVSASYVNRTTEQG